MDEKAVQRGKGFWRHGFAGGDGVGWDLIWSCLWCFHSPATLDNYNIASSHSHNVHQRYFGEHLQVGFCLRSHETFDSISGGTGFSWNFPISCAYGGMKRRESKFQLDGV